MTDEGHTKSRATFHFILDITQTFDTFCECDKHYVTSHGV